MKTEQNTELYMKLLKITAESRYGIMKEIWNLPRAARALHHNHYKDLISDSLTRLREEIYVTLMAEPALSSDEFSSGIAGCEDMAQVKKNIALLALTGLSDECIADLNCVSKGYVRIFTRTLKEDFPEIFEEI